MAGKGLSACIQIFGYPPLKIHVTAVLIERTNQNLGGFSPPSPPPLLVYTLSLLATLKDKDAATLRNTDMSLL